MATMTRKVFPRCLAAAATALVAVPSIATAQNTFGGQPVNLPPAVEQATPKKQSILTVDSTGATGTYRKISQALAAAEPGDTINVRAGEYNEDGLVLNKSVNIHGVRSGGLMPLVRVSQDGASCISQTGTNVNSTVSDLIFVANNAPCVVVGGGSFVMENSKVFEASLDPLPVSASLSGHGQFATREIVPSSLIAIHGGQVELIGNEVRGGQSAVTVSRLSNPYNTQMVRLHDNDIGNGDQHGVLVEGGANVEFSNNIISGNGMTGIYNDGSGDTHLVGNRIFNNKDDGIYVGQNARHTTLESNEIFSNAGDGVEVHGGMTAILAGNDIEGRGRRQCAVREVSSGRGSHTDIAQGIYADTSGRTQYRGRVCEDRRR